MPRGLAWTLSLPALALTLAACGSPDTDAAQRQASEPEALTPISASQVLVVTGDRDVIVVDESGATVRTIGRVPGKESAQINAVDVSADGTRALISVLNDHDGACTAKVYEVTDGGLRPLYDGAAAVFDPDGARVAHLTYMDQGEFCVRAAVSIRSTDGAVQASSGVPAGATLEDTPPLWPVNWAPDGQHLVLLAKAGEHGRATRIVDVGPDGRLGESRPFDGQFFSPAFLTPTMLIGSAPCCIRPQLVSRDLANDTTSVLAELPGPVRSIRPDRGGTGLWLVLEGQRSLFHWDGVRLEAVALASSALMASG